MADKEYIERETVLSVLGEITTKSWKPLGVSKAEYLRIRYKNLPAADVLSRDEGIKLGVELASMHGATPEQQQLEEAYLKGVEYGMTRRDVRPVVRGRWVKARGIWYTPGGDPVWECSVCGKGRHIYGIEHGLYGADVADGQWVACPNCGADMREKTDG